MPTYNENSKYNNKYSYILEDLCAVTGVMHEPNICATTAESIGSFPDKRIKVALSTRKNKFNNLICTYNSISSAKSTDKMASEDSDTSSNAESVSVSGGCSESESLTPSARSRSMSEELYRKTPLKKRPLKHCILVPDLKPIAEIIGSARISAEKISDGILNVERNIFVANDEETSAGIDPLPSSFAIVPKVIIKTSVLKFPKSASKSPKRSSKRSGRKASKRSASKKSSKKASRSAKPKRISRQIRDDFIMAKHMQAREFNLRERVVQLPKDVEVEESNSEPGTSGINTPGGSVLSSLPKA